MKIFTKLTCGKGILLHIYRRVVLDESNIYSVWLNEIEIMIFCGLWYTNTDVNTSRPRQNCRVFLYENCCILMKLKFVLQRPVINIPALVQIMVWHRPGENHYLNKRWLAYKRLYASLGVNELYSSMSQLIKAEWCIYIYINNFAFNVMWYQRNFILFILFPFQCS